MRKLLLSMAMVAGISGSACAQTLPQDQVLLFSSFRNDGETGLHFAYSEDGLTWKGLRDNKSFLTPKVGNKLMRDPCIIQGPDGRYHMVWTTGWWENNIGIAHSDDLIH